MNMTLLFLVHKSYTWVCILNI